MTAVSVKTMSIKSLHDKICVIWQMNDVLDKSFMNISRMKRFRDSRYQDEIKAFLAYADRNPAKSESGIIHCPCAKCKNDKMLEQDIVHDHLVRFYFDNSTLTEIVTVKVQD